MSEIYSPPTMAKQLNEVADQLDQPQRNLAVRAALAALPALINSETSPAYQRVAEMAWAYGLSLARAAPSAVIRTEQDKTHEPNSTDLTT